MDLYLPSSLEGRGNKPIAKERLTCFLAETGQLKIKIYAGIAGGTDGWLIVRTGSAKPLLFQKGNENRIGRCRPGKLTYL
jgi:hypothetical protein